MGSCSSVPEPENAYYITLSTYYIPLLLLRDAPGLRFEPGPGPGLSPGAGAAPGPGPGLA